MFSYFAAPTSSFALSEAMNVQFVSGPPNSRSIMMVALVVLSVTAKLPRNEVPRSFKSSPYLSSSMPRPSSPTM